MSYAKESHHWYDRNGKSCHTTTGKNGKERNTTLRDARKLSLCPSVTTIMRIVARPGLEVWKRNQILMSALTLPKVDGESLEQFADRVRIDSEEHAKQAAEKGTSIHGILESYFLSGETQGENASLVSTVLLTLKVAFGEQEWLSEKSFCCDLGYGGKVDLHSKDVVVDFKTTEFTSDKPPKGWPEQCQQLAAYRYGLGIPEAQCANLYISTSVPNLVHLKIWTEDELQHGFDVFLATLVLWERLKKYYPGEA